MIKVKEINGSTIKLEVRSFSYQGNFMGESYISFDVNSPVYINFEIGDYIEYRGERFVLNYIPSPIKNGTPGKSGDAFVYMDVKFNSLADELTRCDFLDVVLSDNHVHFTSLSKFSFYAATVKDLADRIQANLNRLYNGGEAWTVTVEEDVAVKDKSLSVDNINCWEALSLVNSDFDANFVISGRTIRIGTAGISVGTVFGYGKGNGLINIEQSTNNDSLIVTRLRAYGSTRNIPYRYYNNLKDSNGTPLIPESMYVNTLMLPGFAENGGDAYVDSPNITRIGIREKSVYFDGSGGLPEIYPSIEGMTAEELKAAGINVNATGRIDEVVSAERMTDDGIVPEDKEELDKKTFTITLKDIGFNPVDKKHLTTETPFISMKTGMCGGREFEITGCEEKGNNYILTCNREMDSSINKAFPNNPYQVSAGDQFVFIGIAMDDIYIKAAEQRLLTAAKDYLSNNDKSKYVYLPKIDKVFMARHPEIASSLKEGNILDFKDTDLGIDVSVIIQSLVIKEGGPVPEYEITLFNDKVVSTIEKIQNSITSLASNTGITIEQAKSLFATWVEAWRVKWFDQKLHTYDPVEFKSVTSNDFESKLKGWIIDALGNAEFRDVLLRSFKSWNFAAGPLGAGVGMVNDDELQTDKLLVRKIMYVLEMMIQRMRFQGGQMVLSPAAGFKVNSVEVFDTYYRLRCHPGDFNEFEVNDQARVQNFNGSDTKYLWSLVVAKGDDYIDISRVDKDGDGVPAEGDEIVQLGNRTNTNRQDAVLLSAVNGEVGIFTYFGINSFDLSGKEGSWFGKHGDKKGAVIKGEVHITAGSDGLDKFNEYEEVSQDIQDAQASANEADRKAQAAQDFIDNTLPGELSELRGIIDGQIESFFYNYDPTMSNYPASSWTTTEDKERHLNDTFTNTSTGASWRFLKESDEYKWVEIADTATKEALKLAGEAKSTAASKRRVFVVEPTPPYEVGDLWTQGVSGDLMRCVKERLSGSYVSSDWEKASKYTDDTKVDNLQIGMVNLLKGSNVELNKQAYNLGYYGYDNKPEAGKTYTLVCCYTLGDSNTYIGAYSSNGGYHVGNLSKKGTRVVESITFTAKITPTGNFDFYQFPNGTYGSKVHWAVLVEGNKGPNAWIPSLSEQGETAAKNEVNNLQIGAVNLAINSSYANNAEGWKSWADKPFVVNDNILTTSQINGRSEIVICPPFDMHSGIEYTISAEVRSDTITSLNYNYVIGSKWGGNNQKIGYVAINTEWNRVKITFKAELTQKAGVGFGFLGTGTIQIRKFKIEIGNKATDWSPAPGDVQKEIEQSSTITKDDFAKEMGYESFQDMADKATEKGGKLVVDGLLNANLIDVETLAANNAFINKLSTNILKAGSITADMLSVAGFTFENNNIYGGSKFGEGAGVNIVSDTSERAFKAYKDENNFVSMFYNSDNDWGVVGKVGGAELLKLGTESIISGWKIKTTGFEGGSFEYPTYSGSSGNYVISGGKGSKLFPDGGIMLIPTGTGILQPSSGLMQAGLIKAEGTNAMITGLEVIAHRTGTDGTFAQVTALKLSAQNDYSNPRYTPVALDIANGDMKINGSIKFADTWKNIEMQNYSYVVGGCGQVPASVKWSGSSNVYLEANQTVVMVNNSQHFNIFLPDARNLKPGHTVKFIPWQSSYSHGIAADSGNYNAKIKYKATLYDWILVKSTSGGRVVIVECTYVGNVNGYNTWVAGTLGQDGIEYGNN